MNSAGVSRAAETSMAIVLGLDLPVSDAIVLHDSNKLAFRLVPCDIVARVAHIGREVAALEVELAQRLGEGSSSETALQAPVFPTDSASRHLGCHRRRFGLVRSSTHNWVRSLI